MVCSPCGVGVLALYALLVCLSGLRRYVCRDHEDLSV
jgi:hypothetical protein